MNPDDAQAVEEQIRSIAQQHGLAWLIEQTEEVVREGKPQFKRPPGALVRDVDELVPAAITRERGILETEPYSPQERSELFARALGQVIADAAAAQEASAELLLDTDLVDSVVFVDELELQPTLQLERERAALRSLGTEQVRLAEILEELEARIRS
jgi:hypothetical protein